MLGMELASDMIIAKVIKLAAQHTDIVALWLYGSRALGTAHAGSDYDVAVAFQDFSLMEADRRLRPHLLAMDWRAALGLSEKQLTIVDINTVPIPLALNVIQANGLLLAKDDLRVIREHNRIWGLWSDIQWHQYAVDNAAPGAGASA